MLTASCPINSSFRPCNCVLPRTPFLHAIPFFRIKYKSTAYLHHTCRRSTHSAHQQIPLVHPRIPHPGSSGTSTHPTGSSTPSADSLIPPTHASPSTHPHLPGSREQWSNPSKPISFSSQGQGLLRSSSEVIFRLQPR